MPSSLDAELQQLHRASTISLPTDDCESTGSNWLGLHATSDTSVSKCRKTKGTCSTMTKRTLSWKTSKTSSLQRSGIVSSSKPSSTKNLRSAAVISESVLHRRKVNEVPQGSNISAQHEKRRKTMFNLKDNSIEKKDRETYPVNRSSRCSSPNKISLVSSSTSSEGYQTTGRNSTYHARRSKKCTGVAESGNTSWAVSQVTESDCLAVIQPFHSHVKCKRLTGGLSNLLKRDQRYLKEEEQNKPLLNFPATSHQYKDAKLFRGISKDEEINETLSLSSSVPAAVSPASSRSFIPSAVVTNKEESFPDCSGTGGLDPNFVSRSNDSFPSCSGSATRLSSLSRMLSLSDVLLSSISRSTLERMTPKSFSGISESKKTGGRQRKGEKSGASDDRIHISFFEGESWQSSLLPHSDVPSADAHQSLTPFAENIAVEVRTADLRGSQSECVSLFPLAPKGDEMIFGKNTQREKEKEAGEEVEEPQRHSTSQTITELLQLPVGKKGEDCTRFTKAVASENKDDQNTKKDFVVPLCDVVSSTPSRKSVDYNIANSNFETRESANTTKGESEPESLSNAYGVLFPCNGIILPCSNEGTVNSLRSSKSVEKRSTSFNDHQQSGRDPSASRFTATGMGQAIEHREDNKMRIDAVADGEILERSPSLTLISSAFVRCTARCKTMPPAGEVARRPPETAVPVKMMARSCEGAERLNTCSCTDQRSSIIRDLCSLEFQARPACLKNSCRADKDGNCKEHICSSPALSNLPVDGMINAGLVRSSTSSKIGASETEGMVPSIKSSNSVPPFFSSNEERKTKKSGTQNEQEDQLSQNIREFPPTVCARIQPEVSKQCVKDDSENQKKAVGYGDSSYEASVTVKETNDLSNTSGGKYPSEVQFCKSVSASNNPHTISGVSRNWDSIQKKKVVPCPFCC